MRAIDDLTGFPEIMDGRVKTLNPRLYAGLLALRDNPEHLAQASEHDIEFVDLVCVNLYPFERTVARAGVADADAIENIDIGGPTMIRAAAKNHGFAAVVTSPESYDAVLEELNAAGGTLSPETRESLAAEAFSYTARYDTAIARWFSERRDDFPDLYVRAYEKAMDLPYGENPHQRAAFYTQVGARRGVLTRVRQLHGKQLSFNNILDLDGARAVLAEVGDERPACVIVKHNNPCGAGLGDDGLEAYRKAFAGDPVSAFGGIIALNRTVDMPLAEALSKQFIEVLIAPAYDEDALALLTEKPNVRILEDEERRRERNVEFDIRQVDGGMLVQDRDVVDRGPLPARGRHGARADRGGVARPAVRVGRLPAREVERDRRRAGRGDARDRRRPDEPRGLGEDRDEPRMGAGPRRPRARLGRVLPVPRRPERSARRRRQGPHPARRVDPRR